MIKELFLKNHPNFFEGQGDGNTYIPNYDRKEIFSKKSLSSRPTNIANSEILNYLFVSDFKYIYCSTTIINGEHCICLILDEYLIKDNIIYEQTIFGKEKRIFGLCLENYPELPHTYKHRLICTIRIDKPTGEDQNHNIYIYSYKGKTIEPINNKESEGNYNFCRSLNVIQYCDTSKKNYKFIFFPESVHHGIIKTIFITECKLTCSRLEDF